MFVVVVFCLSIIDCLNHVVLFVLLLFLFDWCLCVLCCCSVCLFCYGVCVCLLLSLSFCIQVLIVCVVLCGLRLCVFDRCLCFLLM